MKRPILKLACQSSRLSAHRRSFDYGCIINRSIAIYKPLVWVGMIGLLAGLFAISASPAAAAITFDAASSAGGGAVSSLSWSHTVGSGDNRMLVVGVATESTANTLATSVTFGSQSLTRVPGSYSVTFASSIYNASELWYLPAPTIGTGTVTVNLSPAISSGNGTACGAVSLFGVKQQAGPEAVATNAVPGSGSSYSLGITTLTAGAWLVDVVNNGTGAAGDTWTTTTAGMTKQWSTNGGPAQMVAACATREVLAAGTVTETWNTTGTSRKGQSIAVFAPATDPSITTQPVSLSALSTGTASFSVTATGTAPFSYQWQATNSAAVNAFTNLVDGGGVSGSTTNLLTLANVTGAQALAYRVIVTNVNGAITSSVVGLTLIPAGASALFITNASFEVPAQASTHTYIQLASGTSSAYLPGWTNVTTSGGIFSTLYNPGGVTNVDGSQVVEAFAINGSYAGDGRLYQVLTNTWIPGAKYQLTCRAGNSASSATYTGCTLSLDTLSGTTLSQLATTAISSSSSGLANYTNAYTATGSEGGDGRVVVAIHFPAQNSGNPHMWVDKFDLTLFTTPVITGQPASLTNSIGTSNTFTVAANGAGTLSYQWQATNSGTGTFTNILNGGQFSGATTASLTITNTSSANALGYQVIVTNSLGSVTSSVATMTVLTIPAIITGPVSQTVLSGSTVTFNVTASGVGLLSYQWQANGGSGYTNLPTGGIFSGITSNILTLAGATANNALTYQVIVTNANGAVTSSPAILTVLPVNLLVDVQFNGAFNFTSSTATPGPIQTGAAVFGTAGDLWNVKSFPYYSSPGTVFNAVTLTNADGSAYGLTLTVTQPGNPVYTGTYPNGTPADAGTTNLMASGLETFNNTTYPGFINFSIGGLSAYTNSAFSLVIYAGSHVTQTETITLTSGAAGGNTGSALTTSSTSRQLSAGAGVAYNLFSGILTNGTLSFRVAGGVAQNSTLAVNGFQLQLGPNSAPNVPIVVSPAANATGVTNHAFLNVQVSDPDTNNLTVTFYGRPVNTATNADFTIIALPDTQFYSETYSNVFFAQTDWIVANRAALNISYVAHLGDCVQNGDHGGVDNEWQNATNALYRLENPLTTTLTQGIPYGVAVGNHDQGPAGNGVATDTTTFYNQYFGTNHFRPFNYYGNNYGTNSDNFYELFSANGLDFIAVYFEYDPTLTSTNAPIFTWANNLLQTNANRRAIVVSHYLINSYTAGSSFGAQGQAVYDALKGNSNLTLMLCGHVNPNGEGRRTDVYNGNTVQTMLSDYQDLTSGGNGWLRIYTFSPTNNVIHAKTYSPFLDAYQTGANSQFDVPYAMAPANSFAVIGTVAGVASGTNALTTWFGLTTNTAYEWYATVSDGQLVTTGAISSFTTAASFPVIPPTVAITSPANNSGFSAPATIALTVNAADADGAVTNVAYYQGATKLADVASSPFTYNWSGMAAGSYALKAVATDDQGLMATSSVVNVSVTNSLAVQILQQAKTVFVIAMENHNWTQPSPGSSPQQIFANSAAPYINSLVTPGHSNAVQVSYATKYYNAGVGVHPSESSYIWAEAGTDFGYHTDLDPTVANGNVFTNDHLTRQMNVAGVTWKSYQEDMERAASPTNSANGSGGPTNPYHGSTQYDYAVKHNPMAFFSDTQAQNVYAFTNFLRDLTNNAIGRYNWITPDQFNDQHSSLSGGFTNQGVAYTGDQAAIAQGDNFLSIIVPKIMASAAYKDHGVIIIWYDESEGGDSTSYAIPEIIISPLAKGNAYASAIEFNHSSDIKTMEEIFGLPFLNNPIPGGEVNASGSGYNNVATVNDLSDLFKGIPTAGLQQSGVTVTNGGSALSFGTVNLGASVTNTFTVTNSGLGALTLSNIVVTGANAGDFTVSGLSLPASVAAGTNAAFKITFTPSAFGSRLATLQVTNNDALNNPFAIALTGIGNPAPLFSVPPISQTNYTGTNVSFRVTASGAPTLGYQWQATNAAAANSFTNLVDGGQVSGGNSTNLTITGLTPANALAYQVIVTNASGGVTSSPVKLTVVSAVQPGDSFEIGVNLGGSQTVLIIGGKHSPTNVIGGALTLTSVTGATNGTVSTDDANITYTATNGAADQFTYTVSDGYGGTAGQSVRVFINTSAQSFNQLSATINLAGNAVLKFVGFPGDNYALDWAHNLSPPVAWIPVFTNAAATNGFLIYTNTPSGGVDFYRTRYVP